MASRGRSPDNVSSDFLTAEIFCTSSCWYGEATAFAYEVLRGIAGRQKTMSPQPARPCPASSLAPDDPRTADVGKRKAATLRLDVGLKNFKSLSFESTPPSRTTLVRKTQSKFHTPFQP